VKSRFLRFLDLNNRVLVDKRIERRHHPMPSTDGFNSDDPLPLLLAELKQQDIDIGKAWDRAILTASILGATATAIFVGILWVGNPLRTNRRFSPAPGRLQQFNLAPMLRLLPSLRRCHRPQRMRRPATKWLPLLNLLIRSRRKIVSHHLRPCWRSTMVRRHGSYPCSPFKMLRNRLRKMRRH